MIPPPPPPTALPVAGVGDGDGDGDQPAIPKAMRVAVPLPPWMAGATPPSPVLDEVWAEVLSERSTKARWAWSPGTVGLRRTEATIFCEHRTSALGSFPQRAFWRLRKRWPFALGLFLVGFVVAHLFAAILAMAADAYVTGTQLYVAMVLIGLALLALWKDTRPAQQLSRDPLAGFPKPHRIHPDEIERFEVVPRGLRLFLNVRHPVYPQGPRLAQTALLAPHGEATMEELVGIFDWLQGVAVLAEIDDTNRPKSERYQPPEIDAPRGAP